MPHTRISLAAADCIFRRPTRYGPVQYLVIHTTEGSYDGAIAWFRKAGRKVPTAAHYVVSKEGDITQMVPDDMMCFHAGNYAYNATSIGIEHEGHATDAEFPEPLLVASAKVAAVMVRKFSIPFDRAHILGHCEVPRATHTDPGPGWPWERYMQLVHEALQ